MSDAEQFDAHLGECESCVKGEMLQGAAGLCPAGRELLFEAVEDLPLWWQQEACRLREREQLEREAEANFRYYEGCEEI